MLMHCINVLRASKIKIYFIFLFEYVRPRGAEKAVPQGTGMFLRGFVWLKIRDRTCSVLGAVLASSQHPLCPCAAPQHGTLNPMLV